MEYSLISRGIEDKIPPACRELGIGITAYGALARGLISGHWQGAKGPGDFRVRSPRFQEGNVERNLALVETLREIAASKGACVAQLAIAWVATQGNDIVPLVGARRRERLSEALGAPDLALTPDDLAAIEQAVPKGAAVGERYDAKQMAVLDSEKSGFGEG
ncbi:aldo/keto reductase [Acetobacter malorum]|uniref:aldo/keto reductase n=1 Tax=Acetobacter malorum TaxID=178901 RepID=UPI0022B230EA|nr:aldo/keto reductase [Acetobacter malorum]